MTLSEGRGGRSGSKRVFMRGAKERLSRSGRVI